MLVRAFHNGSAYYVAEESTAGTRRLAADETIRAGQSGPAAALLDQVLDG